MKKYKILHLAYKQKLHILRRVFLTIFIGFIFAACSKMEKPSIVPPTTSIPSNIVNKSPKYSGINSTTSSSFANQIFPGFYITVEKASKYKFQINEISPISADYRFWDPSKCYLDYNLDGKLDMMAFLTNFKDAPFASNFGKILLVDDFLGAAPKLKVVDANRKFMPRLKTIDLNNDGVFEVLFSAEEDHMLVNGTYGSPTSFQLATINNKGDITYKQIGEPVSIHGQSLGDVDKDGDLDILVWRSAYTNPNNEDLGSMPILYLNDGSNNFLKTDSFSQFKGLDKILPVQPNGKRKNYAASTVELFDVDGDGNLDILASYTHNQIVPTWEYNHISTRVYWGNGSGTFDFENRFSDLPLEYLQGLGIANNINVSPLGFSFVDFDKDGDIDILTVSTPNYGGYIIQLCENLGNRMFRDVTKEKFDTYNSIFPRNSQVRGTFPNFYELRIYDIDDDGDFDLVPNHVATWDIWEFSISQNLYWENTGNGFKIKR
jgi:hypothetical protein